MAAKKKADAPVWQVIIEEIRSQNRLTIEAVEASRVALEERIDRVDRESRARDAVLGLALKDGLKSVRSALEETRVGLETRIERLDRESRERDGALELAIREVRVDLRLLQAQTTELSVKVDALSRIESRVTALEKRLA